MGVSSMGGARGQWALCICRMPIKSITGLLCCLLLCPPPQTRLCESVIAKSLGASEGRVLFFSLRHPILTS